MALLDEQKVKCLLAWINLEAQPSQPIRDLTQLLSLERLAAIIARLSHASSTFYCTIEQRRLFIQKWITDMHGPEALSAFPLYNGLLFTTIDDVAKLTAMTLYFALNSRESNESHVALIRERMEVPLQLEVMHIFNAMSGGCKERWYDILYQCAERNQPSPGALSPLNDSFFSDKALNGSFPAAHSSEDNSPLSPKKEPSSKGYRHLRQSVQRKWESFRRAKHNLAEKAAQIDFLNFERQQMIEDIRKKSKEVQDLKTALSEEKTCRLQLETAKAALTEENERLSLLSKSLGSEKETLENRYYTLFEEAEELRKELHSLTKVNGEIHKELMMLRSKVMMDRERCNELETALYKTTDENSSRIRELEELVNRLTVEKTENMDRADEIDSLYQSISAKYRARKSFQRLVASKVALLVKFADSLKTALEASEVRTEEALAISSKGRQLAEMLEQRNHQLFCCVQENQELKMEISRLKERDCEQQWFVSTPRDSQLRRQSQPAMMTNEQNTFSFGDASMQHELKTREIFTEETCSLSATSAKIIEMLSKSDGSLQRSDSSATFASVSEERMVTADTVKVDQPTVTSRYIVWSAQNDEQGIIFAPLLKGACDSTTSKLQCGEFAATPVPKEDSNFSIKDNQSVQPPTHLQSTFTVEMRTVMEDDLEKGVECSSGMQTPTTIRVVQSDAISKSSLRKRITSAGKIIRDRLTKSIRETPRSGFKKPSAVVESVKTPFKMSLKRRDKAVVFSTPVSKS